ncbi:MAG: VOC family protein [Clostridia bacterium]|nr:VOC family protein [Clostridia bacterium]
MKYSFTSITVKNMEESLKFYTEVLSLKELVRFSPRMGVNIVFLKNEENNKIELIEYEGIENTNSLSANSIVAIGFTVENLDNTVNMLKEKNIEIIRGPIQIPNGQKFVYVRDPNGAEIVFIQGLDI